MRGLYILGLVMGFCSTSALGKSIMDMSLEELMSLKVTSTNKFPEFRKDAPSSITIITKEDINRFGYRSLQEILEHALGLFKTEDRAWFGRYNFGVRGTYSKGFFNDMVILINGIDTKSIASNGYTITRTGVPIEAIEKIEIIKGPVSILYGSHAFLGAVNIWTNDPNFTKGDRASLTMTNNDTVDLGYGLEKRFSDFQVRSNFVIGNRNVQGPRYRILSQIPPRLMDLE